MPRSEKQVSISVRATACLSFARTSALETEAIAVSWGSARSGSEPRSSAGSDPAGSARRVRLNSIIEPEIGTLGLLDHRLRPLAAPGNATGIRGTAVRLAKMGRTAYSQS